MEREFWLTFSGAIVLALVHLFAGKLRFISMIPRSKWLSFGGGISVAYVFIHVMPELEEWQLHYEGKGFLQHHLYLLSLAGLTIFYGLERAAKLSKVSARQDDQREVSGRVFYIHLVSFSLYNALIGYLLVHRNEHTLKQLIFYLLAMAFHFVINDFGLHDHYQKRYRRVGRYILTLSIIAGWVAGQWVNLPPLGIGAVFGVVSGGVILNTLKEELPEERRSNFLAFMAGCVLYSAVLLLA
ncbi:hypothetical protein AB9P05_05870 [Roseivirga sp. BDSF3-8]|uniref:hypothetical protein n=1 Tax=Roseivirga sp. BDSF3-8 TaxID=3241598 RepID=UPI0035321BE6